MKPINVINIDRYTVGENSASHVFDVGEEDPKRIPHLSHMHTLSPAPQLVHRITFDVAFPPMVMAVVHCVPELNMRLLAQCLFTVHNTNGLG